MQVTRQRILELLRDARVSTVEELAVELRLTPVTVRHHLDILKVDGLVEVPEVKRRDTPGRPQYTFRLTPAALAYFPKNYQSLSHLMLTEMRDSLSAEDQQRVLNGVAARMAAEAAIPGPEASIETRLEAAVTFLNSRGYVAEWTQDANGAYLLSTHNCPYHEVRAQHGELCSMDLMLVSRLLGASPARKEGISDGGHCCSYMIAANSYARSGNMSPETVQGG